MGSFTNRLNQVEEKTAATENQAKELALWQQNRQKEQS